MQDRVAAGGDVHQHRVGARAGVGATAIAVRHQHAGRGLGAGGEGRQEQPRVELDAVAGGDGHAVLDRDRKACQRIIDMGPFRQPVTALGAGAHLIGGCPWAMAGPASSRIRAAVVPAFIVWSSRTGVNQQAGGPRNERVRCAGRGAPSAPGTWRRPCRRRCTGWPGPYARPACPSRAAASPARGRRTRRSGGRLAMAPPLTLTRSVSQPRSLFTAQAGRRTPRWLQSGPTGRASPGPGEAFAAGRDRPVPLTAGSTPAVAKEAMRASGGQAAPGGLGRGHQHQGGGAVVDAAGIAGRDGPALFWRRAAAWPSVRAWSRGGCIRRRPPPCRPCGP